MNNKIRIVTYHYVRPIKKSSYPGLKGMELSYFKKQLDYIQSRFKVISYEELIKHIKTKKKLKSNSCLLTFDDGYKDHLKHVLPELLKRNIKGLFFPSAFVVKKKKILDINKIHFILAKNINSKKIKKKIFSALNNKKIFVQNKYSERSIIKLEKNYKNTDERFDNKDVSFIKYLLQIYLPKNLSSYVVNKLFSYFLNINEKKFYSNLYMTRNDLKKMIQCGMYIGGHGYNHVHLNNVNKKIQSKEINENIKFLKSIGAPIKDWIMCYPHGSYNNNLIKILKKKNCICALTTKKGFAKITKNNYFELKRFDTNDIKI